MHKLHGAIDLAIPDRFEFLVVLLVVFDKKLCDLLDKVRTQIS